MGGVSRTTTRCHTDRNVVGGIARACVDDSESSVNDVEIDDNGANFADRTFKINFDSNDTDFRFVNTVAVSDFFPCDDISYEGSSLTSRSTPVV